MGFNCKICSESFTTLFLLAKHSKTCKSKEDEKTSDTAVCFYCRKGYSTKYHLNSHKCDLKSYIDSANTDEVIRYLTGLKEIIEKKHNIPGVLGNSTIIAKNSMINSNNNTTNNISINIVVNNISDYIDVVPLIKRQFFEDYYNKTKDKFAGLQKCIETMEENHKSKPRKDLIKLVEKQYDSCIASISADIMNKMYDLFERILLSSDYPENHMIFIQNRDQPFFIHDNNKWNCIGDMAFLEDYAQRIFGFFVDAHNKIGFVTSSNMTQYAYDRNRENINSTMSKRIFNGAYSNNKYVSSTYDNTKDIINPIILSDEKTVRDTLPGFNQYGANFELQDDDQKITFARNHISNNSNACNSDNNNHRNSRLNRRPGRSPIQSRKHKQNRASSNSPGRSPIQSRINRQNHASSSNSPSLSPDRNRRMSKNNDDSIISASIFPKIEREIGEMIDVINGTETKVHGAELIEIEGTKYILLNDEDIHHLPPSFDYNEKVNMKDFKDSPVGSRIYNTLGDGSYMGDVIFESDDENDSEI